MMLILKLVVIMYLGDGIKNKIDNIEILQGDLTAMDLDIIVNAANNTLLGGGVIDDLTDK